MDRLQIGAAADQLAEAAARAFEQHRHLGIDKRSVERPLLVVEQYPKRAQTVRHDSLRHLAGQRGGRGSRTRAVLEGIRLGIADFADRGQRRLEIGVVLAGIADDKVTR